MQSGRRFFITGWRTADAVAAFAARLARAANGTLTPVAGPGAQRWLFVPQDDGDITLARGLCAEYDVALCLHITDPHTIDVARQRPSLIVDPSRLQALKRYGDGAQAVWRAQAGCTLEALVAAGLSQFSGLSPRLTLAQWASGRHDTIHSGDTASTGVIGADVLFADGTVETLGGFGAQDTRALKSPRVQAAVPALFELTQGEDARVLRQMPQWRADARLDALMPGQGQGDGGINVARVFLGNQGRYGWILQWLLRVPEVPSADAAPYVHGHGQTDLDLAPVVKRLNHAIGQVLDPENLYGGATAAA